MQAAAPASSVAGANACRQTSTCLPCSTRVARTASTRRRPPAWRTSPTAPPSPCAISPTRPLALFGHSLGAALAYETALRLESAGAPLRHLFVSAHPAPHRQRGGALHRGDEAALLEDVRRQGGASELLEDADLRALFLPILRADYQAIETYRRAQPIALACALDVLLGEHDEEVSAAEAQAWSDASRTPARLRHFPGGHFYLSEGRDAVIEHLLRRLAHPDALSREVA